jgi:hypothetical protein
MMLCGDWVKYSVEEPALLAPKLDKVRVFDTSSSHMVLNRVFC